MSHWNVFSIGWHEGSPLYATVTLETPDNGVVAMTWNPDQNDEEIDLLLERLREYIVSKMPGIAFPLEMGAG